MKNKSFRYSSKVSWHQRKKNLWFNNRLTVLQELCVCRPMSKTRQVIEKLKKIINSPQDVKKRILQTKNKGTCWRKKIMRFEQELTVWKDLLLLALKRNMQNGSFLSRKPWLFTRFFKDVKFRIERSPSPEEKEACF